MDKIKKARLGHLNMEYQISGNHNNPVLFFVHSEGLSLKEFSSQHHYFRKDYCVLSASLRGHGKTSSKKELEDSDFNLSYLADDLILLLNHLNISQVHFIGHGLGGLIGLELLKNYTTRLNSLIIFGTLAYRKSTSIYQTIRKFAINLLNTKAVYNLRASRGMTVESKKYIQRLISSSAKTLFTNLNAHVTQYNYLDVIKNSKLPAMILRGVHDKKHLKAIKKTIETFQNRGNFILVHIDDAGYFPNIDQTLSFNQELEKGLHILMANQINNKESQELAVPKT